MTLRLTNLSVGGIIGGKQRRGEKSTNNNNKTNWNCEIQNTAPAGTSQNKENARKAFRQRLGKKKLRTIKIGKGLKSKMNYCWKSGTSSRIKL